MDILRFFDSEHLADDLRTVSAPIGDLANEMARSLAPSAELSAGLRKLLEATDCLVRAKLLEREREDAPPAPPRPVPAARGLIDVGDASGKRGDEVSVEVRGYCDIPVMGFAAAIGFESHHLQFLAASFGEAFAGGEVLAADARDRDHPYVGHAGPHVALSVARFKIKSTDPAAEDPGDMLPPVMLAQGTLLATIRFKIRDEAPVGKALPLLNRTFLFGKPRIVAEFMTLELGKTHRDMAPSVKPALDDGAVVVTG